MSRIHQVLSQNLYFTNEFLVNFVQILYFTNKFLVNFASKSLLKYRIQGQFCPEIIILQFLIRFIFQIFIVS